MSDTPGIRQRLVFVAAADFDAQRLRYEVRVSKVGPLADCHTRQIYVLETRVFDQVGSGKILDEQSEVYRDLDVDDVAMFDEAMKRFMDEVRRLARDEVDAVRTAVYQGAAS